jgi:hypothetical protein
VAKSVNVPSPSIQLGKAVISASNCKAGKITTKPVAVVEQPLASFTITS